jgi:hypothetical protein
MNHVPTAIPAAESDAPSPVAAAAEAGWDPNRVWQDRVQSPRLARELATPAERPSAPTTARPVEGWDPIETWRFRVLRPLTGDT